MFQPFGIKNRSYLTRNIRKDGYKSLTPVGSSIHRPYVSEFFDQIFFTCGQNHVLGTQTQFSNGFATIYYDGSNFIGFNELSKHLLKGTNSLVQLKDYDRITIIIDTLGSDITFPDKFLYINNHNILDMNGYDITITGRVDGEINLTGSGSTLNLSGQPEGLIVNSSLITINHTGTGSYFDNGVLT